VHDVDFSEMVIRESKYINLLRSIALNTELVQRSKCERFVLKARTIGNFNFGKQLGIA
jgi:hypothetical protein